MTDIGTDGSDSPWSKGFIGFFNLDWSVFEF